MVWSLRLHSLHSLDVVGRHVFNPRVGILSVFQAPGLQPKAGLIGAQMLRQMNIGKNLPAGRMHKKEWPFTATWLNGHQRGPGGGRDLLAEKMDEMLNRCSLKDGRQRKFFTQMLLDQGEHKHRHQRVPSQLEKI